LALYRVLGRRGLRLVAYPLVFAFYLFAPAVRGRSRDFLRRAASFAGRKAPGRGEVFRHILSFAFSMVEKMAAWVGDIDLDSVVFHDDDVGRLMKDLEGGKGAVVICSHLGNMELLRALATHDRTKVERKFRVTSIVDFSGTAAFNAFIKGIDPDSMLHLVDAKDIGADTVLELHDRASKGDILAIAGDRTSAANPGKSEAVSFLGQPALFPRGAFVLASLMDAPVYFMLGIREDDLDPASRYDLRVVASRTDLTGSRKERGAKIRAIIEEYVALLEVHCSAHPLQWYNFYDFWDLPGTTQES
jgi:predicted LPLAT superfamily acyltransferase